MSTGPIPVVPPPEAATAHRERSPDYYKTQTEFDEVSSTEIPQAWNLKPAQLDAYTRGAVARSLTYGIVGTLLIVVSGVVFLGQPLYLFVLATVTIGLLFRRPLRYLFTKKKSKKKK